MNAARKFGISLVILLVAGAYLHWYSAATADLDWNEMEKRCTQDLPVEDTDIRVTQSTVVYCTLDSGATYARPTVLEQQIMDGAALTAMIGSLAAAGMVMIHGLAVFPAPVAAGFSAFLLAPASITESAAIGLVAFIVVLLVTALHNDRIHSLEDTDEDGDEPVREGTGDETTVPVDFKLIGDRIEIVPRVILHEADEGDTE